jgi:hypothetical protein
MNYPGVSGLDVRNFYKLANSISGLFTIQSGREKVSNSNLISIPQGLTLKQTNSEKGIVRMTTIHDRTVRILPHIFVSSSTSSAANKRNNIKRDDEMGVIGVSGALCPVPILISRYHRSVIDRGSGENCVRRRAFIISIWGRTTPKRINAIQNEYVAK